MLIEDTPWESPVEETFYYNVYRDKYPVTEGHTLYVPKQDRWHFMLHAIEAAYNQGKKWVEEGYCEGYNIGQNNGKVAGQTIMYPHIHLIPRREGDLGRYENGTPYDPTGGIRNVIPDKGNYKK